ncbi:bridging integrator 2-like isoform X1 [Seriola dumerili]|uniref:Bridging integrator 2a n=1 Tax=Seriola dumerili TaxID=41447 RepID=A0A3B4TB83_SERDU|nr:bridging integrator 2-like isoform X1 [Seriola dumerili]XP_022619111.1 bridging integrator 2-like isoform X1 [Seriola dumerili]XP_022619113.1 bridging integrator 2-like isoform X1 [Seriola dumerili]XP_022619114.1 bridging integrator 2-like isoform X1 [Seriola dumerili]
MTDSTSPKGNSGDFAKKVQRQLSRGKEKVLQRLGKTVETRDDHFDRFQQQFNDQQTDGNRMYKDLRNYINAVRDMREASRRLSQSLFDVYETDWAGEEDLGAIVEGEDLMWNDYEVKLLDQAVRTMESYVSQFPDVREKIAKRGRKLVDYDSSRHHLEALQTAKKRDDIKINKAEEEMNYAKSVYDGINSDLKEELPVFYDSRIGCYVSVFSAMSNLRDIFYKEMCTLNLDLQNVIKELQAQHPDKAFSVRGLQPYGSLRRRTLMSPKAWKASFSEFHRSYNPKAGQRFSFRSPEKPRRGTLSRESSTLAVSPQSATLESHTPEHSDPDAESSHSEIYSCPTEEGGAAGTGGNELKSGEDGNQVEEEKGVKGEQSEPKPPAESDDKAEKASASESSSELNNSCDSESLELKLSALDNGPLHIEEREDNQVLLDTQRANGLDNGEVSGFKSEVLGIPHKDAPAEKQAPLDSKSTVV